MSSLLQPVQLKVFNTALQQLPNDILISACVSFHAGEKMRFCHTAIESATKDKEIVVMSQIQKYLERGQTSGK